MQNTIGSLQLSKNSLHKPEKLDNLALWILEVCYGQKNPSSSELTRVKNELEKIYVYERIPF